MTEQAWSPNPKKSARRARLIRWLPPVLTAVIRLIQATLRYRIEVPPATQRFFRSGKPFLLAFWHGRMLIMPHVLLSLCPRGWEIWTLISQHWDGEIIARTIRPFGVHAIRGSSTRGGREAVHQMIDRLRAGGPVAVTPDGPRGPRHRVQSGILRVAAETGVPIIPVTWSARPSWRLWSWDRFQVPLPFSRVAAAYGEPLFVSNERNPGWLEEARTALEDRMVWLGHSTAELAREACKRDLLFAGYNLLLLVFSVLALPFIVWKLASVAKYRAGFVQRLGLHRSGGVQWQERERPLWVHAVSVGEVLATVPFVRKFLESFPGVEVVVSTITPTGQAVARNKLAEAQRIIYFPFDYPLFVRLALKSIRPRLFIHTETEIWPNFLFMLGRNGIPSAIVNGRISERSSRHYGWFRFFFRRVLANVSVFGMQSRQDCHRIVRIGADPRRVFITGNMKFDFPLPEFSREQAAAVRAEMGFSPDAKVLVAGSTHAGEEEILFEVYNRLRLRIPNLKMLLAPRHPERCEEVAKLGERQGRRLERRTQRRAHAGAAVEEILLLDTIGELAQSYAIGDVVFVGGSLVPIGGHNLLEPIAFHKPVLFGPHTENSVDLSHALKQAGGGIEITDADSLFEKAASLLEDPAFRETVGRAAFGILEENRGATERNLAILRSFFEA